jgi:hypothetical protein
VPQPFSNKRHISMFHTAASLQEPPAGPQPGATHLMALHYVQLIARENAREGLGHECHHGLEGHHLQQAGAHSTRATCNEGLRECQQCNRGVKDPAHALP